MKKISIIIPCYNVENYIVKCLESILNQTYMDLEVICINDGSTDQTLQILKNIEKTDGRMRVINQENKGLSETRNVGISEATAEYIMFVDSDDWLESNTLEKAFETGFDLICFSYNRVFRNKSEPRKLNISGEFSAAEIQRRMVGLLGKELSDPSQANSIITAWAKIFRTKILKENRIRFTSTKEIGTEDALFNIQYLECCHGKVKIVDEPLYNYVRYNSVSLSSSYKPNLIAQWKLLHQKIFDIIKNKNQDFHQAFNNRIALSIVGLGLNEMERKGENLSKLKNFSKIINEPLYIKAYQNLDLKYFPFHWLLLFLMAKYRFAAGVFLMMKLMSYLWKRKNN